MHNTFISMVLIILSITWGASCATRFEAAENYKIKSNGKIRNNSHRTVFLFLVDGLSISTLKEEINKGHLPYLTRHFFKESNQFYKARTGFPSVTFPSIASLLTERSIDQHKIYGNKVILQNQLINFETPQNFQKLDDLAQGQNVFSRLAEKGYNSVSLSFTFNKGATSHIGNLDFKAALASQMEDYEYIDTKFIDSLEILLNSTPVYKWPDFVYIHLVGVDFLSHEYGPASPQVLRYLQLLDRKLSRVLQLLEKNEKKRNLVTLMTSDHGYDRPVTQHAYLESVLPRDVSVHANGVLNEGRFVGFDFPITWTFTQKMAYAQKLKKNPALDVIVFRDGETVHLLSKRYDTQIFYGPSTCQESSFSISIGSNQTLKHCPQHVPYNQNQVFYPYFATHIAQYFHTSGHPDIVIITKSGTSFDRDTKGQHGGPTPEETFVPLLIRNGQLPVSSEIIPLSDLLKFL